MSIKMENIFMKMYNNITLALFKYIRIYIYYFNTALKIKNVSPETLYLD